MFTLLGKVFLVLFGLVVGAIPHGRDNRSFAQVLSATLDLCASAALTWLVAVNVGLLRVKPLQSRGYEAIGELMVVLALLALKFIAFVVVPAVLLTILLRRIQGLTWRLVTYGVFAVLCAGAWYLQQQRATAEAELAAIQQRAAEDRRRAQPSDAQMMADARANAERREFDEQARLADQALALSLEVRKRWRADVEAAGAIGTESEVPALIAVLESGPYEYQVRNLSARRMCVNVVRFVRKPGTDTYLRCELDELRECSRIAAGSVAKFVLMSEDRMPACASRQFEYRIGTPRHPEPSWWSRSALAAFDQSRPDGREAFKDQPLLTLRGEIAAYEKVLADTDRATRWRQELAALAD